MTNLKCKWRKMINMSNTIQYNTENLKEDSTIFKRLSEPLLDYNRCKIREPIEGNEGETRNALFALIGNSEIVMKDFVALSIATESFLKNSGISLAEMDRKLSKEIEK